MIKQISIILLFCFFLASAVVYAEDTLNLDSLISEAIRNNPEVTSVLKKYEAAKARIPQAKSLDDPVIGLKFEKAKGNPFHLDTTPAMDRMLSFSQMFPWFGKLPLKGKIALVESQMFAAELKNTELDIVNQVRNAYYNLFLNYKEIELKKAALVFLKDTAGIAEAKYIAADASQEEIFKINLEITTLSDDIANLKLEKLSKETSLNVLLNKDPESPLGGEPALQEEIIPFDKDIVDLYKLTIENQPELLVFSYAIERNKYAKSLAQKSFFPDLMAGIVARGITAGSIGPWDLMLSFTVPLWFWSKQRYEVKEAITNLEQAQAAYQAMKNKALARTKDLITRLKIASNKIKLYRDNQIPILNSSIDSSLSAYRSG
ncbi:MAG: TolC family protein, partial [Candidatus Omnitrophica bacterium]|nr:TolC family protein [Candidatus Omnitrophota bacterium]